MMKNKFSLFNKLPNIMLLVVTDIIILFVTSFLLVLIRFDFGNIADIYLLNSYKYIFVDSLILILIFSIYKLYTSIWKYASVPELLRIIFGSVFTETIFLYMF